VSIKETFENDKNIYIVMEQVKGGELFDHIKMYQLEEHEVTVCMFKLIQAIQYLNESGVVHRDLKPENILIEKNPLNEEVVTLKITDFGLSKIVVPGEIMHESCGTPAYVAPEVLKKEGYTKEVDMWSAGIIMYTLMCRQLPFSCADRKQTFKMIKEEEPDMTLPQL
jgi:calcium/calmodulin-dependent protein kinase I